MGRDTLNTEEEEERVVVMLPLYKRSMRHAWVPYRRLKRGAVVAGVVALLLLFLLFTQLSPAPSAVASSPDPVHVETAELSPPPVERQADGGVDTDAEAEAETQMDPTPTPEPTAQAPFVLRLLLPLVAGFCFGFLGSVPVAGPTSAMVLKLGIQGKYTAGLTIAVGGAISEATYAGIAFWGFGSFLAGAKFLLPVSKVLGAIMFTLIGLVFLRADMKPSLDPDAEASHGKGARRPQGEVLKNILMGLTMSGINPALLASYTGAIASGELTL
ncbi:hypothetical protein PHYBOEH_008501 [Phytophthora boehmeriae]|uniref:Lysine transporter LysE n=1 Tax=Phytophthora boehmeriae TaxID=109152 RepID=A0A8T1XF91_9STRA|nr:hypothetical protein PHYBOEH_008501 [Phytophthora boehmeriae]